MTIAKFAIGEVVDFENRNAPARKPAGPYSVTRVLPVEDGGSPSYRIKCATEPFERIAKEFEIIAIVPGVAAHTG